MQNIENISYSNITLKYLVMRNAIQNRCSIHITTSYTNYYRSSASMILQKLIRSKANILNRTQNEADNIYSTGINCRLCIWICLVKISQQDIKMLRPTCITASCLRYIWNICNLILGFILIYSTVTECITGNCILCIPVSLQTDGKLDTCNKTLENRMLDHENPIESNATLSILM